MIFRFLSVLLILVGGICFCDASTYSVSDEANESGGSFFTKTYESAASRITDIIDSNGFVPKPEVLTRNPRFVDMVVDELCGGDLEVGGMLIIHRPFDPAAFDSLVDSVAKYAEFISWDMLQDSAVELIYLVGDNYALSDHMEKHDFSSLARYNLRKKFSTWDNNSTEPDSMAIDYLFDFIRKIEEAFNGGPYHLSVQTVWLPIPVEDFWFVLGFLTNGELSYTPGNVMIDKRTFTLVKEWCWVNRNKFRYPVIKKIKNSMAGLGFWYDKETDGPPFPYEKFVKDYDDLRRQVEEMNLIPLSTITEILESIEDTCPH